MDIFKILEMEYNALEHAHSMGLKTQDKTEKSMLLYLESLKKAREYHLFFFGQITETLDATISRIEKKLVSQ